MRNLIALVLLASSVLASAPGHDGGSPPGPRHELVVIHARFAPVIDCEIEYEERFSFGYPKYDAPCQRGINPFCFQITEDNCFVVENMVWTGVNGVCTQDIPCVLAIEMDFTFDDPCDGWAPLGFRCDPRCCDGNAMYLQGAQSQSELATLAPHEAASILVEGFDDCEEGQAGGGIAAVQVLCKGPGGYTFVTHFGTVFTCGACQ